MAETRMLPYRKIWQGKWRRCRMFLAWRGPLMRAATIRRCSSKARLFEKLHPTLYVAIDDGAVGRGRAGPRHAPRGVPRVGASGVTGAGGFLRILNMLEI